MPVYGYTAGKSLYPDPCDNSSAKAKDVADLIVDINDMSFRNEKKKEGNMKEYIDLAIREDLVKLIISGAKVKEFRKVSKGLVECDVRFVSIKKVCQCGTDNINTLGVGIDKTTGQKVCRGCGKTGFRPEKVYATAHLKPSRLGTKGSKGAQFADANLDKESFLFVLKNYTDKHDFMEFKISDVIEVK